MGDVKPQDQPDVLGTLERAVLAGTVSHAYIFSGDRGLGKTAVARHFVSALFCKEGDEGRFPCGRCRSCLRVDQEQHADLFWLRPEGASLKIDQVKEMVQMLQYRPFESDFKVAVLEEAERMTDPAANSLLKILEEPPGSAVIILLTASPIALLPTIRSRCLRFSLRPVPVGRIEEILRREADLPEERTRLYAAVAKGNPGQALDMVDTGAFESGCRRAVELLQAICSGETLNLFTVAAELDEAEELSIALEALQLIVRDEIVEAAGVSEERLIPDDLLGRQGRELRQRLTAQAAASAAGPEVWAEIVTMTADLERRLESNVNRRLALEVFLHRCQSKLIAARATA